VKAEQVEREIRSIVRVADRYARIMGGRYVPNAKTVAILKGEPHAS
jgi:hypothetical protein